MLLLPAVQQGGGEGVEPAFFRQPGGGLKTPCVAVETPFVLAECHLPEELLQFIVSPDDQLQSFPPGKGLEGAEALFKFLIGLDVGIVKETVNVPARVAQLAERVNGARCAADVQKDLRQGLLSPV